MNQEVFDSGIEKLLDIFPGLKPSQRALSLWEEYLQDLNDKQFLWTINEVCKNVQEIKWGTNIVALIRMYSLKFLEEEPNKPREEVRPMWEMVEKEG